jgi:spore coat protein H
MGVDRYCVNGLLQVGDENGPVMGELGYGQNVPNATVSIRGQSSSKNEQKNYKITIKDNKGTWNDQKVINLNKHVSDYSRFTNKLCYDLMTQIPDMISLRTQFVHLYVKDMTEGGSGEFEDYGLYTQVEQLNKRALKSHGLDKNGQLYKVNYFEFYRYPDVIKLKNDADYDVEAFEEMLEIKGNDDHSKLIEMLEDVNDYSISIDEIMDKWFCEDNLFSWMAFHILMGNIDTQSRNVFLYSPLNSSTWYFISWDNDGAFSTSKNARNRDTAGWETGVSNYWGNVLFRRILLDSDMRQKLDDKIEEYVKFIDEEKLNELIDVYAPVVEEYSFKEPDLEHMSFDIDGYREYVKTMAKETQLNYASYKESLTKPMPFYIGKLQPDDGKLKLIWDASYDFDAENVYYTVEISDDYSFENPVVKADNLYVTEYMADVLLEPGQYFIKVTASMYMLAPIVIPVVIAQNIYIRSSGSLIAVR